MEVHVHLKNAFPWQESIICRWRHTSQKSSVAVTCDTQQQFENVVQKKYQPVVWERSPKEAPTCFVNNLVLTNLKDSEITHNQVLSQNHSCWNRQSHQHLIPLKQLAPPPIQPEFFLSHPCLVYIHLLPNNSSPRNLTLNSLPQMWEFSGLLVLLLSHSFCPALTTVTRLAKNSIFSLSFPIKSNCVCVQHSTQYLPASSLPKTHTHTLNSSNRLSLS